MRKVLILSYALLLSAFCSASGNVHIYGKITNRAGEVLPDASILLIDSNNALVQYEISDANGEYHMEINRLTKLTLMVQYLGYRKSVQTLELASGKENKYRCDFVLIDDYSLPEVIVISEVEPDTVNMKLDKYVLKNDDELKKLLTRNPNFNVGEDGTILYKGKNIDKILVNGKETFDNQNSIALDNIKAGMLSGLQVVNNYKDPFSMVGDEFETVLNLRSKKPSANLTTGEVDAAYGLEANYKAKAAVMRFSSALNGFFVENANNINASTLSLRELTNLFDANMSISPYMVDGLNNLFENKIVYKKDISNANFTVRGSWNNRIRLNASCYYIYDDYWQSSYQNQKDGNSNTLYESDKSYNYKSGAFLLNSDISYKISPVFFINYKLKGIYIKPKFQYQDNYSRPYISNTVEKQSLEIGEEQSNTGVYNQIGLQYKLSLNEVLSLDTYFNREYNKVDQKTNSEYGFEAYAPLLGLYYQKKNEIISLKWTHEFSKNTNIYVKDELVHVFEMDS